MILGQLLLGLALVSAALSAVSYGLYYKNQDLSKLNFGNKNYYVLFASLLLASGLLMVQILSHNFQVNYVYSYSSRSLPTFYLISTFWAGQEGTFLLWAVISSLYGLFLLRRYAQKNPLVLVFLLMVNMFLVIILLKKSPFAMIWDVHKDAPFGFVPPDGNGLNPLLQNPWMVIHPPMLFVGYAATVVPFAFAMSALVRKDFYHWSKPARPWAIFTVLSLGTGIMLGGYWAYTTLGWGGYWGWDPVENSSLIPWLLAVALLHGIIIQKRQNGLVRTNFFLAGLSFMAMLWGSFLTRSGVLTDFSVHSFGESGLNRYLITFIVLFVVLFLYFYTRARKKMKAQKFVEGVFSRETITLIGIITLVFSALFTFVGTSSPIFTGLVGKPSSVSANFYNTIHIPIMCFLLLTVAMAPILAWKISEIRNLSVISRSGIITLCITILAVFLGLTKPISILLFFLSGAVITINGYVLYKRVRNNSRNIGGYLTHLGIGLMMIGILTSSVYDISQKVTLPKGTFQATRLGYDLKFLGFRKMPNGKDRVRLEIKSGDQIFSGEAQFYWSDFTKSYMVSPYVKLEFLKDLYISPISFSPATEQNLEEVVLHKGETKEVHNLNITFHNFEMGGTHEDPGASMVVKANLTVNAGDGPEMVSHKLQPEYIVKQGGFVTPEIQVPDRDIYIKIGAINATEGAIKLQLISNEQTETQTVDMLGVEISTKPLIFILWFGTLVSITGMGISLAYRMKQV